jgi:hypothetical protein
MRQTGLSLGIFGAVLLAALLFGAFSVKGVSDVQKSCIRKLELEAGSQKGLSERARRIAQEMYPKICAELADSKGSFPERFDIVMEAHLRSGNLGQTRIRRIILNEDYLEQFEHEPGLLESVLVHEMVHVAQHYSRPLIGHWLVVDHHPPVYWVEGIADYICIKLAHTNAWSCAECGLAYPHYRNGYSCAGAFLLYLECAYNPAIARKLNAALRDGHYAEDFFVRMTGKELPTLWAEFQKTPAFTPSAERMLRLQKELGFVNGTPPKDIEQRLKEFVKAHTDTRTMELMGYAEMPGIKQGDLQSRLALICYFAQPGGSAEGYMVGLQDRYELPGFCEGEHGTLNSFLNSRSLNGSFPAARSFTATKQGDASTYHYTVLRQSVDNPWSLQRAWRTAPDGSVAEEYCIPSHP